MPSILFLSSQHKEWAGGWYHAPDLIGIKVMLFCSLNALQQLTCFSQLQICVKTVAAGDSLNTGYLDFDGCLPLGSAGRSISYHILHSIAESIRSVTHIDLYVNLYLLFRQLVSKGLFTSSFGLHCAPIVHSGHSLLLYFT